MRIHSYDYADVTLLRLLHLASPALPIGGFHFSQGLEYAVGRSWVHDEASGADWIGGLARHTIGRLDLPVMLRLYEAFDRGSHDDAKRWNDWLIAARETSELRAEDLHMGSALAKVLIEHELDFAASGIARPAYATAFAFACVQWRASPADTLTTYSWTWLENQVLAAVKLIPLGQSAGQRMLASLTKNVADIVSDAAQVADADIGVGAVMHSFASALHESQYTRLFRS